MQISFDIATLADAHRAQAVLAGIAGALERPVETPAPRQTRTRQQTPKPDPVAQYEALTGKPLDSETPFAAPAENVPVGAENVTVAEPAPAQPPSREEMIAKVQEMARQRGIAYLRPMLQKWKVGKIPDMSTEALCAELGNDKDAAA